MVKYSIIIPHYNIPDLLGRCLASIPEREDIQVIVVDDCSPDAKEYPDAIPELSRPFVEFYSTPIGGSAGRARNIGVQHATGKWVTFLDADDLFVDNVGQIFDKYSDRTEDVIYFRAASVMSDDLSRISDRNIFGYHFETYFKSNNEQLLRFEFDALWGKLIRKSLIDKYSIRFDEVRYSNDTFFSAAIGVFAKSICVAPETAYIVTERSGSLTAGKMKTFEEWKTRYGSATHVQKLFDEHHIKFKRYAFADFLLHMWNKDKSLFIKEFSKLSFQNKRRYIYYHLRDFLTKVRSFKTKSISCL